MRDLSSRWIVLKGILFLVVVGATASLLLMAMPAWRTAALIGLLVWASARAYYFLFYVLERYVDPRLRYHGLVDLLRTILGLWNWRTQLRRRRRVGA